MAPSAPLWRKSSWSGAGVGVGMLREAGDSLTWKHFVHFILRATPSAAGPFCFIGLLCRDLGVLVVCFCSHFTYHAFFSSDCHFGSSVPSFWHSGTPFWHLGSTLGCRFDTSRAPRDAILAPRNHPGGPWEQQDGPEVANNRIFFDFGMIWGPVYISFWKQKCFETCFLFKLVSRSSSHRFLTRIFDVWDLQIVVFALSVLQKSTFHEKCV